MTAKIYMRSLGCPKNSVDSEKTLEAFAARGLLMTSEAELADIVIINTCGFINDAKEESINTIIELAELKKKSRTIKLVVMGCLSERYKEDLFKQIPEIDHIYGVDELNKIISELTSNIEINYNSKVPLRISSSSKGWSYLKISEGCSNTCSFCIIPKIRGPYKSRNQQSVIAEAKSLSALGVKELILVAQDSTIFGADLHMKDGLAKLLEKLSALEEIDWIRALYMYPALVTDALISVMAKGSKVLPYFDIPIQHGSNSILQSMGRPERRDDIRRLITKIRSACPDATIRTSVMVGFPGETNRDFDDLISLVEELEFDNLGVFEYSPEEGSKAYNLPKRVDKALAKERRANVMELQKEISRKKLSCNVGKIISVIVEGFDEENVVIYGRSKGQVPYIDGVVILDGVDQPSGSIIDVKVVNSTSYDLIAQAL
tara:strand:- start:90983 stop:92278 length:1296 start_codon:yes stop_codon:yes gene_type:complete